MTLSCHYLFTLTGIYNEPNCSNTTMNHAVLVVGYNSQMDFGTQTDYWIVKNRYECSRCRLDRSLIDIALREYFCLIYLS